MAEATKTQKSWGRFLNPYLHNLVVVEEKKPGESELPPEERLPPALAPDASPAQKAAYNLAVKRARAAGEARMAKEEEEKRKELAQGIKKRKVIPREYAFLVRAFPSYLLCLGLSALAVAAGILSYLAQPRLGLFAAGLGFGLFGYGRSLDTRAHGILWREDAEHRFRLGHMTAINTLCQVFGVLLLLEGLGLMRTSRNDMIFTLFGTAFLMVLVLYALALVNNRDKEAAGGNLTLAAFLLCALGAGAWYTLPSPLLGLIILASGLVVLMGGFTAAPLGSGSMPLPLRMGYAAGCGALALIMAGSTAGDMIFAPVVNSLQYTSLIPGGLNGRPENLVWDSSGTRLAFCDSGLSGGKARIMVLSPESGTLLREAEAGQDSCRPVFLDDPDRIAFDAVQDGVRDLYVVSLADKEGLRLTTRGISPYHSGIRVYSPAERRLYYLVRGETGSSIESVLLTGTGRRVELASPHDITGFSLAPSADEMVYVEKVDDRQEQVWRADLGRDEKRLISNNEEIPMTRPPSERPHWVRTLHQFFAAHGLAEPPDAPIRLLEPVYSPDGGRIALVEKKGSRYGIRVLAPHGQYLRRVFLSDSEKIRRLDWSGTEKIYFESRSRTWTHLLAREKVKVVEVENEDVKNLLAKTTGFHSPAVSPGSVRLAFASSDSLWYPSSLVPWGSSQGSNIWVALLR